MSEFKAIRHWLEIRLDFEVHTPVAVATDKIAMLLLQGRQGESHHVFLAR